MEKSIYSAKKTLLKKKIQKQFWILFSAVSNAHLDSLLFVVYRKADQTITNQNSKYQARNLCISSLLFVVKAAINYNLMFFDLYAHKTLKILTFSVFKCFKAMNQQCYELLVHVLINISIHSRCKSGSIVHHVDYFQR